MDDLGKTHYFRKHPKRHHELSNTVALCLASNQPQQKCVTALGSGSSSFLRGDGGMMGSLQWLGRVFTYRGMFFVGNIFFRILISNIF